MLALLLSLIMGFFIPDEKPTPLDKFHAEIDLRYSVGLYEQECGATFHDSATRHGMMGFTFRLAALYDFTPAITAGVAGAVNLQRYPVHENFAFLGIIRYRPIVKHRNFFLFGDVGYAPSFGSESIPRGWVFNTGAGYCVMFRRHFGLSLQLGYMLNQFIYREPQAYMIPQEGYSGSAAFLRHSLGASISFVF